MNSIPELLNEVNQLRAELDSIRKLDNKTSNEHKEGQINLHKAIDGLWDWNLETNEVYYSASWKSMLGYDEHELECHFDTWAGMVHPDDKALVLSQIDDFLSQETDSFEVEIRMQHKSGHYLFIRSRALQIISNSSNKPIKLIGTHADITHRKQAELFDKRYNKILKMIAQGEPASNIYDEIAHIYEERHPGIRCSMLELDGETLLHAGAPSLPQAYCDQVNGLKNGPSVGSCGTSTYTGKRVVVENIETDPKWELIKNAALPHGMRSCWSEPILSITGKVLGAFGMYRNYPSTPNEAESNDLTSAARLAGIVMEREHNQKRIKSLAYSDSLTGLSSRAHLFITIENLIKASSRNKDSFSLLYLDLDNFKSVNDSLGHDIGDYLLTEIANRIKDISRDADCVSRLGGDEFCIVVKDMPDSLNSAHIAQRVINVVAQKLELLGRKFIPSCSIGIARYPADGDDLKTLIKAADTALYSAKDAGKGCYAFYDVQLTKVAEYQFRVEQFLRETIENKHLTLAYQPQVDVKTGQIVGVEALSRWSHHELGDVAPLDFIATAERIGMIKQLSEWVFNTACAQAVKWQKQGLPNIRMAVNISPSHLFDDDFIPTLQGVINDTKMHSNSLELEVTESAVQTSQKALSIFRPLKELGVLLAIDDFGTGYSSFASLKHLSVDYLKIDKHFVDDILTDDKTKLLVRSMIEMGHNLGYKIIAEGVETIEQFQMLESFGCDIVQGFLFSEAVTADQVSTLLVEGDIRPLH
jgi:diguanylate cyclase (GGDEF)-like protein/PAS domain S-box-containing protein